MTKPERALKAAEQLPEEMREKLGDDVLHFVDRYLALRADLEVGLRELDAGHVSRPRRSSTGRRGTNCRS